MLRRPAGALLNATAIAAVLAFAAHAEAIDQPDCLHLEEWSTGHDTTVAMTLAPKVQVSGLFADDRTVPVFGAPVRTWDPKDFTQLEKWLTTCRRAASKRRDKAASDQFYRALKVVMTTARSFGQLARSREQSARAVRNLVAYHRSQELTRVLDMARRALGGANVSAELRATRVTRGVRQEVMTLQNARDYLPADDVESLVAELARGADEVGQQMAAQDAEFEALKRELDQVPMTSDGARTLDRLNRHPVLSKVPRQQALEFENAVMRKRIAINRTATRQSPDRRVAPVAAVAIAARLEKLLVGEDVEDLSIQGIRPGIDYEKSRQIIATAFGMHVGEGAVLLKEFTPTRRDVAKYTSNEQRDGGDFQIETMRDIVGQVRFIEHYTGRIDLDEARDWLIKRFGKPNQFKFAGDSAIMAWEDDGTHLTITPGNRTVLEYRSPRTYRSSLVITLWSDDYRRFLVEAKARCERLMNKPAADLSVRDKMDLLQGCK